MILAHELKRKISLLELRRDLLKVQINIIPPEYRHINRLYLSLYAVQSELRKLRKELASLAA